MKKSFELNGTTVEIELTREVIEYEKIWEGYEMGTERQLRQRVSIVVTKNEKSMSVEGENFGDFAICEKVSPMFNKSMYEKGARGRIGNGYVGQELYDAICEAYAKLDTEVTKSEEYVAIENEENLKKEIGKRNMEELEKMEREQEKHVGWCKICKDWTYGDCGH